MKRILSVMAAAAIMVALLALAVGSAFADEPDLHGGVGGGGIDPSTGGAAGGGSGGMSDTDLVDGGTIGTTSGGHGQGTNVPGTIGGGGGHLTIECDEDLQNCDEFTSSGGEGGRNFDSGGFHCSGIPGDAECVGRNF